MKLTIEQSQLYNLLKSTGIIKPSATLEITRNNLLRVDGNKLIVSATDMATELTQWIEVSGLDAFEVLVPRSKFIDLVGSFGKGDIELSLVDNKLLVEQGKGKARLAINPEVDLFPSVSRFEDDSDWFEVDSQRLKDALSKTVFAAAKEQSRPILQGVYWFESMQAVDGFRLSFIDGLKSDKELIIPASFMSELNKLLPDDGMVKVQGTQNKVLFEFDNTLLVATLLAGQYPDVSSFMTQENSNRLVLDTKDAIAKLKQAHIFAREVAGEVVKITANSALKLEVQTHEDSYVNEIEVVEGIDGEVTLGIKCSYFLEALTKIDTNTFSMQIDTGNNPIIIESGEFRHVIMPMSIKGE